MKIISQVELKLKGKIFDYHRSFCVCSFMKCQQAGLLAHLLTDSYTQLQYFVFNVLQQSYNTNPIESRNEHSDQIGHKML